MGLPRKDVKGFSVALRVTPVLVALAISVPTIGPVTSPTRVTSGTVLRPAPYRVRSAATNGLLKVTEKPLKVGVKAVTTRPRVLLGALVPVMVGRPNRLSVAVIVWLPAAFRVMLN